MPNIDVNDLRIATAVSLEQMLSDNGIETENELYFSPFTLDYSSLRRLTKKSEKPPESALGKMVVMEGEDEEGYTIRKEDLPKFQSSLKLVKPKISEILIGLKKPYDSVAIKFSKKGTFVYTQDPNDIMPVALSLKIGNIVRSMNLEYKGRYCYDLPENKRWQL
jgi:hypothetical protein